MTDDPDPTPDPDSPLERCRAELGEPTAVFRVDPLRFRSRMILSLCLVVGGIAGNYLFWMHGPAHMGAALAKLLLAPPIAGGVLLWHSLRSRGLTVLLYPTGALRLQGRTVESYPWADVADVRVKNAAPSFEVERDADGHVAAAWIGGEVPTFQIWNAHVVLRRSDDTTVKLTPVIGDYAALAELVQVETFRAMWPKARASFRAGEPVAFGTLVVSAEGFDTGKKRLPWSDLGEVKLEGKAIVVKRRGGWNNWATVPIESVPNAHVLLALVGQARENPAGRGVTKARPIGKGIQHRDTTTSRGQDAPADELS